MLYTPLAALIALTASRSVVLGKERERLNMYNGTLWDISELAWTEGSELGKGRLLQLIKYACFLTFQVFPVLVIQGSLSVNTWCRH